MRRQKTLSLYIYAIWLQKSQTQNHHECIYKCIYKCVCVSFFSNLQFYSQNGAISVPDTVQDDDEGSDGTPTDDVESAAPIDNNKGGVKFGWIRGVLVSYVGS